MGTSFYHYVIIWTDYPNGASVQQPQSPPTVQTQEEACSQPLIFSEDMSSEQLALWLRNHPSLSEAEYEEDISKLRAIYLCMQGHTQLIELTQYYYSEDLSTLHLLNGLIFFLSIPV